MTNREPFIQETDDCRDSQQMGNLEQATRGMMSEEHDRCMTGGVLQLQSPGHYSPLEAFYEDKRAILPPGGDCIVTACPASAWGAAINHSMHPEMK
ncbi:protein LCHN-like protein, partial [Lates japonicus]